MQKIIIKQANNRNIAHIYEHVLLNFVEKKLFEKGYFNEVDYVYSAYTIGNIVVFSLESKAEVIKFVLKLVHQFQPSLKDIKWAVQEISNEYFRPYHADFDKIFTKIAKLNQQRWQNWQGLSITKPVTKTAAQFRSPEIQFLRPKCNLFEVFCIENNIKNIVPELKPLAAYVLYYLQIGIYTKIRRYSINHQPNYCDGYDWNVNFYSNLDDIVGRRLFFIFQKNVIKANDILQQIKRDKIELLKQNFVQKVYDKLHKFSITGFRFNNDELFEYSGFMVGPKYFKKYATRKNIEKIVAKIEFLVELEK